jgi:uncharacterized membrane protein (DUF4010 family)
MKSKNLISLSVAFIFLVIGTTGLLMYLKQKSHPVEMAHTVFGLLFVGFAIFHISNNWGSIKSYSKDRISRSWKKELLFALAAGVIVLTLALTEVWNLLQNSDGFLPQRQGLLNYVSGKKTLKLKPARPQR